MKNAAYITALTICYIEMCNLQSMYTEAYRVRGLVLDVAGSEGITLTEDELREVVREVMGE